MTTDLTFITNEQGQNLAKRFSSLIKDTRYFDCLVGYFYASGLKQLITTDNKKQIRLLNSRNIIKEK